MKKTQSKCLVSWMEIYICKKSHVKLHIHLKISSAIDVTHKDKFFLSDIAWNCSARSKSRLCHLTWKVNGPSQLKCDFESNFCCGSFIDKPICSDSADPHGCSCYIISCIDKTDFHLVAHTCLSTCDILDRIKWITWN